MKLILERWNRFILDETIKEKCKNLLKEGNEDDPEWEVPESFSSMEEYHDKIGEIVKLVLYSDFDEEKISQARYILKNEEIHPGHVIGEMLLHLEKDLRYSIAYKVFSFDLDDRIEVKRLSIPTFIAPESRHADDVIQKFEEDLTEIYEKADIEDLKRGRLGNTINQLIEENIMVLHSLWSESIRQTQDSDNLGSLDFTGQTSQDVSRSDLSNTTRNEPVRSNVSTNRPD